MIITESPLFSHKKIHHQRTFGKDFFNSTTCYLLWKMQYYKL